MKCLLIFYGLIRTFNKTKENLINNLIKFNTNIEFDILVTTTFGEFSNTKKHINNKSIEKK
jgi:hypothetical protein